MLGAMVAGPLASLGGVVISAFAQPPAGATIVLVALAGFVATCAGRDAAAAAPAGRGAVRPPGAAAHETADERTATCTGRAAATSRSSTATTSTTSTTATATPSRHREGSTMTSTEPDPAPATAPDAAAAGRPRRAGRRRRLPLRAGGPRAARRAAAPASAWPRSTAPSRLRRPRARRRPPPRGRRGDLPPVLRHPPPSPGLPLVRCDGRGRGSGGGEVDLGDRRRARLLRPLPHAGDLRHLRRLPQGPI